MAAFSVRAANFLMAAFDPLRTFGGARPSSTSATPLRRRRIAKGPVLKMPMECRVLLDWADCLVKLVQLGQQGAQVTHVRIVNQTRFEKGPRDISEAEARIGLAR